MTGHRHTGLGRAQRTRSRAGAGGLVLALLAGCSGQADREAQDLDSPAPSVTSEAPSPAAPSSTPLPSAPTATTPTGTTGPAAEDPSAPRPQPTVPARPVERLPPVPLAESEGSEAVAEAGALRIEVVDVASVVSAGAGPGQVRGEPAVAFTVRWSNVGTTAVPLGTAVVDLSYGSGTPASPVDGPPSRAVARSVPPGGSVSGVYVFAVPADQRARVALTVSEGPALPTAVFVGPVP